METSQSVTEPIKELTSTLFIMNGIAEQLEKERDVIVSSASQISTCTKQFEKAIQNLTELSPKLTNDLERVIITISKAVAENTASEINRFLLEKTADQMSAELERVQRQSFDVNHQLARGLDRIKFLNRGFVAAVLGAVFLGGLFAGGLVHYLFPPIDATMSTKLQYGEYFSQAWPKLSEKEQEQFMAKVKAATKNPKSIL
ncbi:hypothetical protein [Candidatus Odyssella thessalonicensis]|uniref:hypothetical protein n=1 Tax=Candidatus Odyssella thessalonicensis TaxID=84647 RepID=UPI000225B50B|nr:hypothetical protein [Candidatus Odyssella thessalonicensis]